MLPEREVDHRPTAGLHIVSCCLTGPVNRELTPITYYVLYIFGIHVSLYSGIIY